MGSAQYYQQLLSLFSVYPAEVLQRELGAIPKTAVKFELPLGLERILGDVQLYRLHGEDASYMRLHPTDRIIQAVLKEADKARMRVVYDRLN